MSVRLYSISWLRLLGVWLLLGSACWVEAGIEATKHNLAASSGNTHKATTEERVCLMCHTPHNADPAGPLWNHQLSSSGTTYTPYSSTTLNAAPGQPTGASKLCLACHDGTIAVGALLNMPGAVQGYTGSTPYYDGIVAGLESMMSGTPGDPTGSANLGIDLSDDHPVSFVFNSTMAGALSLELNDPAGLTNKVRLDSNEELQCTTCHDPHVETPAMFLRMDFTDVDGYGSPLCRECHNTNGWAANNKHRDSEAQWNGVDPLDPPWHIEGQNIANDVNSTPKSNGCESCHQPHNASTHQRVLKADGESALCLTCHDGRVSDGGNPTYNMETPLGYNYNHMTTSYSGRHSPTREALLDEIRERSFISEGNMSSANTLGSSDRRHAECQDCHNAHWAREGVSPGVNAAIDGFAWPNQGSGGGTTMDASPVLKGVWGVQPDDWPPGAGTPAAGDWGDGSGAWLGSYTETFTEVSEVLYQYQLCLKCHSYYAYGTTPPDDAWSPNYVWSTQDGSPGWGGSQTDQAMEFNPNNPSYHPVGAVGKNPMTGYAAAALVGNLTADSTMGCVDCHYDSDGSYSAVGLPKGAHGSQTWPLLGAPYTETTGQTGTFDHLCFNCHEGVVYGEVDCAVANPGDTGFSDGIENLHCYHGYTQQVPCQACHVALPHGWKRPHLLISYDDTSPYNAHAQAPWKVTRYQYGIDSATNFNTAAGAWVKTVCHNPPAGSPNTVNCSP